MLRQVVPASVLVFCAVSGVAAQTASELPTPQPEHKWLEQFVNQWETESEALMEPGQPSMQCKGAFRARMLGGFWLVSETTGEMQGTQVTALQTIGYDPKTKKYVGTWIDSMVNYMWKYEGTVDTSGKILTLEAEGPNFMGDGSLSKFRDIYEFKSSDEIAVTSQACDKDGKWVVVMTGTARRKK